MTEIGSKFQTGASLNLIYNPNSNPGLFNQFFNTKTGEDCLVHSFVSWNASYTPQYVSLSSDCLSLKLGNSEITDIAMTITVPLIEGFWPSNSKTALRATGKNSNDKNVNLGNFLSIPLAQSEEDQVYLEVYQNSSYSASLNKVKFILFNKTLETNIQFTQEPKFSVNLDFYDKYRVLIDGSIQVINSWEEAVFFIKGTFVLNNSSFQNQVQASVEDFLTIESDKYSTRFHLAQLQMNSSMYQKKYYETQLQVLEDKLSTTVDEVQNAMESYQQALDYIEKNESQFQTIVNVLPFSDEQIKSLYSVCSLPNCSKNYCQFETTVKNCEADVTHSLINIVDTITSSTAYVQEAKEMTEMYCNEQSICKPFKGVRWLSQSLNSSIASPLVNSEIPLPYAYTALNCEQACESGDTVKISFKNVPSIQNISLKYMQIQNVPFKRTHACFINDTCIGELLEEPCTISNYDCQDTRKLSIIGEASKVGVSSAILKSLTDIYHDYANAVNMGIAARALLDVKTFEEEITMQKISLLRAAANSSMLNFINSVSVQDMVKNEVPFINEWLDSYTTGEVFKVNSITFSMILTTESPTTVPLVVNYSIPYLKDSHLASFSFDFRTPFHLMLDRLTRYLVDDLISRVKTNANDLTQYQYQEDVESQFEDNCVKLEIFHSYLTHLQQSLVGAQSDFEYSKQMISSILMKEKEKANNTASSISFFSLKFQNTLNANQLMYLNNLEFNYYDLKNIIEISSFGHWLNSFNEYVARENRTIFHCYDFTDCLLDIINLLSSELLVLDDISLTKISVKVSDVIENLQHLAWKRNLTLTEAVELISPIVTLVQDVRQLKYWCSKKPVISKHPLTEYFLPFNGMGELTCEGMSNLSVSYRWWKDGVMIADSNSANLQIAYFDTFDIGHYICEAYNDVGSAYSLPANIQSYSLPTISTNPWTQVTYSGDEKGVQFECEGSSPYNYYYTWAYKESEGAECVPIESTSNILRIDFPTLKNSGMYQCTVTNMFGGINSDSAKFAVVNASIATVKYPMQFVITDVNVNTNSESADGSDYFDITNDTTLEKSLEQYLKNWTQQGNNTSLENVSVSKYIVDYSYLVYFELASINVSSDSIASNGISSIMRKMRDVISNVEKGKELLLKHLEIGGTLSHSKWSFEIQSDSVFPHTKRYDCLSGQELDENFITCGKYYYYCFYLS